MGGVSSYFSAPPAPPSERVLIAEQSTSTTDFIRRAIEARDHQTLDWGRKHFGVTDELIYMSAGKIAEVATRNGDIGMLNWLADLAKNAPPTYTPHMRRAYATIVHSLSHTDNCKREEATKVAQWLARTQWICDEFNAGSRVGVGAMEEIICLAKPCDLIGIVERLQVGPSTSHMLTSLLIKHGTIDHWTAVYGNTPTIINMKETFAAASLDAESVALYFLVEIEGKAKAFLRRPEHTPSGEPLLKLVCFANNVNNLVRLISRFGFNASHFAATGITIAEVRAVTGVEVSDMIKYLIDNGLAAAPEKPTPSLADIAALAVPVESEPVREPIKVEETKEPAKESISGDPDLASTSIVVCEGSGQSLYSS